MSPSADKGEFRVARKVSPVIFFGINAVHQPDGERGTGRDGDLLRRWGRRWWCGSGRGNRLRRPDGSSPCPRRLLRHRRPPFPWCHGRCCASWARVRVSGSEPAWVIPGRRFGLRRSRRCRGRWSHLQVVDNLLPARKGRGITGGGLALGIVLHGTGERDRAICGLHAELLALQTGIAVELVCSRRPSSASSGAFLQATCPRLK